MAAERAAVLELLVGDLFWWARSNLSCQRLLSTCPSIIHKLVKSLGSRGGTSTAGMKISRCRIKVLATVIIEVVNCEVCCFVKKK